MSAPAALAVMARYPVIGAVKTRLARTIGPERACTLYRAFLRDIETRFARGPRVLVWVFEPAEADFAALVAPGARCLPQAGTDLGQRLYNCFQRLTREGFARVIVIGADVPHVRHEWLDEAQQQLDCADVVLGPSLDGGYYLIAMGRPHDVFSGVEMSTSRVLAQTLERAAAKHLRVHLLPKSFDVDEASDLKRLQRMLTQEDWAQWLPHTAATLAECSAEVESAGVE